MGKKLGGLIKTARTNAGLTQEQLARKIAGVSQSDIGRYERGEAEPTTQTVKEIAKACGVTQKSLLDAMPKSSSRTSSSSKPSTAKPSSSGRTSTVSKSSMQVTATERRLVELYRKADSETRKKALALLRGDAEGQGPIDVDDILSGLGTLLGDVLSKK